MIFSEESFHKSIIKSIEGHSIPVGTVFCAGRNYRKHIEELNSKDLGEPVIFTKPPTSVCQGIGKIPLIKHSTDVHHEVELALIIGKKGKQIPRQDVSGFVVGAAIALDLTLRDFQTKAKKNGTPWSIAKGFDFSCPISSVYPVSELNSLSKIDLYLEKNGVLVQQGNTGNMIFPLDYLVSYISEFFTLTPGDIILTGTPEGVGPVYKGDVLTFWSTFSEKETIQFQ